MIKDKFLKRCIEEVVDYYNNNVDKINKITEEDVFVVWKCKALQNSKVLLGTATKDNLYYEITLNGDKKEMYLDVYDKVINIKVLIEEE